MDNRYHSDNGDNIDSPQNIDTMKRLKELEETRHRKGIVGDTESIQDRYPEFYEKVVTFLYRLGIVTELDGHSQELDKLKDRAFKLIGL